MNHVIEIIRTSHLDQVVAWLVVTYAAVLGAMIVDLFCGIYKAIEAGIATTSTALRRTCSKAQHYYLPLVCLSFADFLASTVTSVPVFSMLWASFCIICEFKSVLEKSATKAQMRDAANTMGVVIKNKDDIAKIMLEVLEDVECKKKQRTKTK